MNGGLTLGAHVRALRTTAAWTLAVLASHCELSISYLNDVEHNRRIPSVPSLHRIARAFDMNLADFLRGVDPYGI